MKFIKEFKEFISKGNVIDLAIGVIIGNAFHKVISSLVSDVLMPPLGILIGGVNFTEHKILLKKAATDASGKITTEAVTLNAGNFIETAFDFLIIAFVIFITIKAVNKLNKQEEKKLHTLSHEEKLLTEIRDLLKQK